MITAPEFDQPYALAPETTEHYQKHGYALVRCLATPEEVAFYRQRIKASTDEVAKAYAKLEYRDTYGKAFIQNMNLWRHDEAVARFTLAKRFGRVAAELMGVKGVRLYHDQALFKEPGGGPTPWHQDQQYWPLDGVKCITLWMPLVNASADMGTMHFAAGSHELGYLGPLNISDDSEKRLADLIHERGYEVLSAGDMAAGDATFHDGWVLHGAPGNRSQDTTREVMTIIYFEDGARISAPDSPQRENDLASWFPGLVGGDLAASELNPVVWAFTP
ncbi:MAG: phytanoyl-CoA dioxygenase family protein [Fimbriimonadaceae bacterium]|nr:phytanoyl-CoA dioxygenase family protein [Fimbriimonadaceae bacterium]